MTKRMARSLLDALGYEIRRKTTPPTDPYELPDPEIRSAIAAVDPCTMQSEGRLDTLYCQVVHCETHGVGASKSSDPSAMAGAASRRADSGPRKSVQENPAQAT